MLDYIEGKLVEKRIDKVIIDVGGLGYAPLTPPSMLAELPDEGTKVKLYTSVVIREDSHRTFAFCTKLERDFFEKLITVSGIGPKIALALIGHLDPSSFRLAIIHGNSKIISKVPGIGKKTAERLIVEMRDHCHLIGEEAPAVKGPGKLNSKEGLLFDATSALINLGYTPMQAQKAVKSALDEKAPEDLGLLITSALQKI